MSELLDDENVAYVFNIADVYKAFFLRALSMFYILTHLHAVMKSENWSVLTREQLDFIQTKAGRWGFIAEDMKLKPPRDPKEWEE